jgi:hypothetical protein
MKIEYSFKDGRCEAAISEEADWRLFNGIADAILSKFKGKLVERLDGFDERYWDIAIDKRIVTLHLQHYLGISLFSKTRDANDLIREVGSYLEGIEPKKLFREWFYVKNAFRIRRRRRTGACS